jgi:hypothetical protein
MIGGPTPFLAKDHGQVLHPRGQDPLAHGGQTRRTAFDSHTREPATTRQPIPFIHEPFADESKRKKTPVGREINVTMTQARAILAYLKWSEAVLTFGRSDHANHIQPPGRFPLVVNTIISETHLTKVLMDGGTDSMSYTCRHTMLWASLGQ